MDTKCERKKKWIKDYPKIDPNFLFVNEGYNLRLTEPQAKMGMTQIKKLDSFIKKRRKNANHLMNLMKEFNDFFIYQYEKKRIFPQLVWIYCNNKRY